MLGEGAGGLALLDLKAYYGASVIGPCVGDSGTDEHTTGTERGERETRADAEAAERVGGSGEAGHLS